MTWGWKTILAGLFWALANTLGDGPAPFNVIGQVLEFVYPILFGVGIADKFVKYAKMKG